MLCEMYSGISTCFATDGVFKCEARGHGHPVKVIGDSQRVIEGGEASGAEGILVGHMATTSSSTINCTPSQLCSLTTAAAPPPRDYDHRQHMCLCEVRTSRCRVGVDQSGLCFSQPCCVSASQRGFAWDQTTFEARSCAKGWLGIRPGSRPGQVPRVGLGSDRFKARSDAQGWLGIRQVQGQVRCPGLAWD